MDGKDFQKHQRTSKSPCASLSIAIILRESVSQLLAMEKSCGSQQRVCFSEKSGMIGVFLTPLFPKKDALTTIRRQSHNLSKRRCGTQGSQDGWHILRTFSIPQLSRSKFLIKFTTTYSKSTGISTQPLSFKGSGSVCRARREQFVARCPSDPFPVCTLLFLFFVSIETTETGWHVTGGTGQERERQADRDWLYCTPRCPDCPGFN
ncbi:hypothetical protein QQF64_014926 [Cirrhinus molitorella]|uniref:Uncharacterized protein n=1 Tax=Cirrhinus molitorella TaxID=172907 RepID=A0ABR3NUS4_9TELE